MSYRYRDSGSDKHTNNRDGNKMNASTNPNIKKQLTNPWEKQMQNGMELALLQKIHAQTMIVGLLRYKGETKGIRFFDPTKGKFIDVAPWHLNSFAMSKLQLMGVRHIELLRHEAGEALGTVLIEYLTHHELAGYYRANRMIPNDLAQALSSITRYMDDLAYQQLISQIVEENKG
ncbi:hypothetical protein [Paenibacillus endoradicis]|uniref:hypothetical protein n=1 Tax=Paenibacillus endoradicis TaxID=2972487 RepID=UPI002158CEB1|nr:hypothetical protein [Paenibacillus endoradicis]MCR8658979.1 hypothetical protein [Paenibacillus endoradicis]